MRPPFHHKTHVRGARRRHNGKVEKQFRYRLGQLPVAYRTEEAGKLLYIMDNAVASYGNQSAALGVRPRPPCCTAALHATPRAAHEPAMPVSSARAMAAGGLAPSHQHGAQMPWL